MKIEVKTDGLAMNHISFVVENHDSQELVGSPAKELEGPGARTELDFLSLHSELESEPEAVNIAPHPESKEDVSDSERGSQKPCPVLRRAPERSRYLFPE